MKKELEIKLDETSSNELKMKYIQMIKVLNKYAEVGE